MVDYRGNPVAGPLDAVVRVPGSKSVTNRALVLAALADGTSRLGNVLFADDTSHMLAALSALGIEVRADEAGRRVEVDGCRGHVPAGSARLVCGNSGTTIRFCTALCALGQGRYELDGVERMRRRPIGALGEALGTLGTGIEYGGVAGYPPVIVHARGLRGGSVQLAAPESSQFISALLMVAPYAGWDVRIEVREGVVSQPYLRMTTALMERFGVPILEQYDAESARLIVEVPRCYQARELSVEPDASNASYFLAAAAVAGGSVTVEGLSVDSVQGDVAFADVLDRAGCQAEFVPGGLRVTGPRPGERLRGLDVDLNAMPDMVPTLAVVAIFAEGPTTVRNVANLRLKETDRLRALGTELAKLGAQVEERADGLRIVPPTTVRPAVIDTYEDHRMAMSFAVAGLKVPGLVIRGAECCGKTFPNFFECFDRLRTGGRLAS
ncbi:MAG TPA: 3-phosphoshikimate 1-carboxyvinyltransferase [Phycisphaerae bacterium]|nr:3-phosphoshikimate 1-carboxyvinyltransferase [Phycisphaerae bacterium]HNU46328.1 3-phosphoshikimate 1-carboxyvinyltransferase [Phycisphaerae bacterium]